MATCKHKPCAVLPKFKGKSGTPKLSLYPAELWEENGGQPGRYRVMIGDAWYVRDNESMSFFTLDGISRLILLHLCHGLDVEPEPLGVLPDTPQGTPVRFWPADQGKGPLDSYTRTPPFTDSHGEWRVWIFYRDNPVLLADLEFRRENRS